MESSSTIDADDSIDWNSPNADEDHRATARDEVWGREGSEMMKLLRSLFKGANAPVGAEASSSAPDIATAAPGERGSESSPARSPKEILSDLRRCLSAHAAEPLPIEEIDGSLPMYDAGYVTSIIAADLLAHIEEHYGLLVRGTDLVGHLQTLDELALHISRSAESSRAE
jgi:hypothetical protein